MNILSRIFKSKSIKRGALLSCSMLSGLFLTGRLEDAYYLAGGFWRGMRCAGTGIKIVHHYLYNGLNEEAHEYAAKKLFYCFHKNSGCYIKLGQIICQLEHIVPPAYVKELEPLCNECPVSDFRSIKRSLKKAYKQPLDEIFSYIDPVPIGSASLAQVHKAILKSTNEQVAIKVQHSHIPYHSPGDILTVQIGCAIAEIIFPDFKYKWLGKEFETNLPKEIDFNNEGHNADRIRELLKDDKRVVIPKIYWEYTTRNILVMSYEQGKTITNMKYIKENKIEIKDIAHILSDIFNKQIFEFGFVHSDPHPGNLLIRKEIVDNTIMTRLVLLDHGLYRDLDESFRFNYASLWRGIITQNKPLLVESCKNLGIKKFELFMSILTSNTYDQLMNQDTKFMTKTRLNGLKSK